MPQNVLYSLIKKKKAHLLTDQTLKIKSTDHSSEETERNAFYIKLHNLPFSRTNLFLLASEFSDFQLIEEHLSIDQYYLQSEPKLPPEHYSAVYQNRSNPLETLTLHAPYPVVDLTMPVSVKKSIRGSKREEVFELTLTEEDRDTVLRNMQPYTELRSRLVEKHRQLSEDLEGAIALYDNSIASSLSEVENSRSASNENDFQRHHTDSIQKIQAVLKLLELYNFYNNSSKIGLFNYYTTFLEQVKQESFQVIEFSPSSHAEVSVESSLIVCETEASGEIVALPPKEKTLEQLMEEAEDGMKRIKELSEQPSNPKNILLINTIRKKLQIDLAVIFCQNTKNKIEITDFVSTKLKFLETQQILHEYVGMRIEVGDLETLQTFYPLLLGTLSTTEIIQNLFWSIYKTTDNPELIQNLLKVLKYFAEKEPSCFYTVLYVLLNDVYILDARIGLACSILFEFFLDDKFDVFCYFMNDELLDAPAMRNQKITFNIVESIIIHFSSNPNKKFLDFLHQKKYFEGYVSTSSPNCAICATKEGMTAFKQYGTPYVTTYGNYKDLLKKSYIGLAIKTVWRHNSTESQKLLIEHLMNDASLEAMLVGATVHITDSPLLERTFPYTNDSSCKIFYNKSDFENEKKKRLTVKEGNFFPWGMLFLIDFNLTSFKENGTAKNILKTIVDKTFSKIKELFLVLPVEQQREYIMMMLNYSREYLNVPEKNHVADAYCKIGLFLSSLQNNLSLVDYLNRVSLLRLRMQTRIVVSMAITDDSNFQRFVTMRNAQRVLNYVPYSVIRLASVSEIESFVKEQITLKKGCELYFNKIGSSTAEIGSSTAENIILYEQMLLLNLMSRYELVVENLECISSKELEALFQAIAARGSSCDMLALSYSNIIVYGEDFDPNACDASGKTALHHVIIGLQALSSEQADERFSYEQCLSLLKQMNLIEACIEIRDCSGKTPRDYDERGILNQFLLPAPSC